MSPRDVNLVLIAGATPMAGTGVKGSVVNTEGGFRADVRMFLGTCSGSSVLVEVKVEASIDGGSNYYHIGQFPVFDADDDDVEIARPVYIPKPDSDNTVTKVRLNTVSSAGSSPVVPCNKAFLEPLLSLAPQGVDMGLGVGLEELI